MRTVLLREWLRFQRAMGKMGLVRFLGIYWIIFGVILPASFGSLSAALIIFAVFPLYIAGPLAVDCFAGERERNTLETLLTAPLTSGELLAGKALFPFLTSAVIAWSAMLLFLLWSFLRRTMPPPLSIIPAVLAGGLVTGAIGTLLGLHVSLACRTVRSAQQWFSVLLLAVALGLPVIIRYVIPHLPGSFLTSLEDMFAGGWTSCGVLLLALLVPTCCAVMWITLRRRMRELRRLNPERRNRC